MKLDDYLSLNNLTEAEFGTRIGRSQAAVNRYRTGKREPGLADLQKIAKVTKGAVQPADFFPESRA